MSTTARIRVGAICYAGGKIYKDAVRDYVKTRFDFGIGNVADDASSIIGPIATIKAYNPNFKWLAYYWCFADNRWEDLSTISATESYFIHTTAIDSAHRITYAAGQYLMNPHPTDGWNAYKVAHLKSIISDYPATVDGFFFDDYFYDFPEYYMTFSGTPGAIDGFDGWTGVWKTWTENQAYSIGNDSILSGKLLMPNCWYQYSLGRKDTGMGNSFFEHFIHKRGDDGANVGTHYDNDGKVYGTQLSQSNASLTITNIDDFYDVAQTGSELSINSGCYGDETQTDYNTGLSITAKQEWCKYVYACLAFSAYNSTDKLYFTWEFLNTETPTTTAYKTWYPWFNNLALINPPISNGGSAYLGDPLISAKSTRLIGLPATGPTGTSYTSSTSYIKYRAFENYYVIINYNTNPWQGTSVNTVGDRTFTFPPNGVTYKMKGKTALFIPNSGGGGTNQNPTAEFSFTPTTGIVVGTVVTFNGSASSDSDGYIVQHEWDWDYTGSFSADATYTGNPPSTQPTHSWGSAGTKTVALRVKDDDGAYSQVHTETVTVESPIPNQSPTASFTISPTTKVYKNITTVTFNASASSDSDGNIENYKWDLNNDGTFEVDNQANPIYTKIFTTAGTYTITLQVTDDDDATDTETKTLVVYEAPQEVTTWYSDSWPYRKEIIIPGDKIYGNLTNFPILYKAYDLGTKCLPDGTDIIFSSPGGSRYHHEIVSFSNYEGYIWVQIPELVGGVDKSFYIYYGNTGGGDQTAVSGYKPSSTWDDTFAFVCHMKDSGSNNKMLKDSTKYRTPVWKSGAIDNPNMVTAFLGSGQKFRDPVTAGTMVSTNSTNGVGRISSQFSVSVIVSGNQPISTTYLHAFDLHRKSVTTDDLFALYINGDQLANPNKMNAAISTQAYTIFDVVNPYWPSTNAYNTSVLGYGYLSGSSDIYNGYGKQAIYVDGKSIEYIESTDDTPIGDLCDTPLGVIIGNRPDCERPWSGSILDVQLSKVYRDSGWFSTMGINISSLSAGSISVFYNIGLEEVNSAYSIQEIHPKGTTRKMRWYSQGTNKRISFSNV